jgi:competence protein CoiA
MEIYEALLRERNVQNVVLERPLGEVKPDISAYINGVPVAIEVQISNLSLDSITERTIWYARKGIYVLWLLQWSPRLDGKRYSPKLWERWIHAAYFGRVYYWTHGLTIASYSFEPALKSVRLRSWYSRDGKKMISGGYTRRLARHRVCTHEGTFNLVRDFGPKERFWWEGGGLKVPDGKFYIHQ